MDFVHCGLLRLLAEVEWPICAVQRELGRKGPQVLGEFVEAVGGECFGSIDSEQQWR